MNEIIVFFSFLVIFSIAYLISEDAEQRGMHGNLWFLAIVLLSIFGLILYLILRKPKLILNEKQSNQSVIFNLLKDSGYFVEYQNNFKVNGIVIRYKSLEYEIKQKDNQLFAKLIPPTKYRILFSLFLSTLFLILTVSYIKGYYIAIGFILFLVLGTYILDLFYNLIHKKTSNKVNLEIGKLIC